jgi:RHS repeat-associated protein
MPTDKLFTGQQKEPVTSVLGLYNYGARFYSTLMGRFVSPDPLIASPGDPQTLNRYSYVRNNPLVYVDPSGLYGTEIVPQSPFPSQDLDAFGDCPSAGACLEWIFGLQYGISPNGLVIVMGFSHTEDDIEQYSGYALYFLDNLGPAGCRSNAAACWNDLKTLMGADGGGAEAVYRVFGIRFIMSDPGGYGVGVGPSFFPGLNQLWRDIPGVTSPEEALENIIENPEGKTLVGVVGHSLGAYVVQQVFLHHQGEYQYERVRFFLDEPWHFNDEVQKLPNYAGYFAWGTCYDCGFTIGVDFPPGPLDLKVHTSHGVHDRDARYVFWCLERAGRCP